MMAVAKAITQHGLSKLTVKIMEVSTLISSSSNCPTVP
jgi:hypothetical protein